MSLFEVQNPQHRAPSGLLSKLISLPVSYLNFVDVLCEGTIIVHTAVAEDITRFFKEALALKFPIHSVCPIHEAPFYWDDEVSCQNNNSSSFNYRTIHGSSTLSKHSLGTAFDINPVQNIYIKYDTDLKETYRLPTTGIYDINAKGTLYATHPLVHLMKSLGWTWGGEWTPDSGRVDYQHFEKFPPELAHYLQ